MKAKIRGIQHLPRGVKGGLPRQARSQHEIFNELARLGREKEWLNKEMRVWQERLKRIDVRLGEIDELQDMLQRQIAMKEESARNIQDVEQTAGNEKREVVVRY